MIRVEKCVAYMDVGASLNHSDLCSALSQDAKAPCSVGLNSLEAEQLNLHFEALYLFLLYSGKQPS